MKCRIISFALLLFFLLSCGRREYKNPVDSQITLTAPQEFRAVQQGEYIKLTWEKNSAITSGYEIERKKESENFRQIAKIENSDQTSYLDTTITSEIQYTYRLKGFSDANSSDYSVPVSFKVQFAPNNLRFLLINDSQIRLMWQDNSTFESGYRIERNESSGDFVQIAELSSDVTSYEDSNLDWQTDYTYRVYAFTAANQSDFSNATSLNISKSAAPANLQLTVSVLSINLSWTDRCAFEDGFRIERKDAASSWQQIADLPANSASYSDTGLDYRVTYTYRVYAYVTVKQSTYSNEVYGKPIPFINMVFVEGSKFTMGDTWGDGYSDEKPTHQVTLSSFYISKHEVIQAQYQEVMGANPSYFSGDNKPVEKVSWYDAVEFCNKLSEREGYTPAYTINGTNVSWDMGANGYRLPTEAEWEYAARGGSQSQGYKYSGSNTPDVVAWYRDNSGSQTHNVGIKQANELGLFDMSGNVWEWCWDWFGSYSSNTQTDPTGPASGSLRVLRGGGWEYGSNYTRIADRDYYNPTYTYSGHGFRIVRAF